MSRWPEVPLKRAVHPGQYGLNTSAASYRPEGIRFVRTSDISESGALRDEGVCLDSELVPDEYRVDAGDLLLSRAGTIGRCHRVRQGGVTFAGYLIRFRVYAELADPAFLEMVFLAKSTIEQIEVGATTNTIANFNAERYGDLIIPLPPLPEQAKIAAFLDAETNRIDTLIAAYEHQIELLHEEFNASQDGLMPNDDFPARPLKRWASVSGGVTVDSKRPTVKASEVAYLRVANVQDGELNLDEVKTILLPPELSDKYRLQAGDVLLTEGGDPDKLGRGAVWNGEIDPCVHQNHIFSIRPDASLDPHYLALATRSSRGKAYFESTAIQTTGIASTNSRKVKDFPVPHLDSDAQRAVVERADDDAHRHAAVFTEISLQIEHLHELRQALITTAVTEGVEACEAAA